MRRPLAALGALAALTPAAVAAGAGAASASWSAPGAGLASATTATLTAAAISVPATASETVAVTWSAQAALAPSRPESSQITYVVQRRLGDGPYADIAGGGCAGALAVGTTSCVDAPPASGSYRYRVVATYRSWTATSDATDAVPVTVSAPLVEAIARLDGDPSSAPSLRWRVTFSEPVGGVGSADFALVRGGALSGGAITDVSGDGATYVVTASTGSGSGTLGLDLVDDDSIADGAGTPLAGAGAGNGDFSGPRYTVDRTPPARTGLQMLDTNANGRIDHVDVTFDEPLAATTATAPWTLTAVPSGGALAAVATSGATVSLTLTEGAGAPDTAVSAFTVALAADASGVRDAGGNPAAFAATAPLDRAGPVPVAVADANGAVDGTIETGDSFVVAFSEALAGAALPAYTPITEDGSMTGVNSLTIAGITNGALDMTSANYVRGTSVVVFAATSALDAGATTITTTVGACAAACGQERRGSGTALVYVPAPTLLDAAGNGATGSRATGFRMF